jgi:CheY-like chemotaxis protein
MDIEMPEMTGIDATSLIKSDPVISKIPVVIFTSLGSEEDMKCAYETGAEGFLNKPVSRDELLSTVQKLLNQSSKRNNDARYN